MNRPRTPRRQLSMFVPDDAATEIERVRSVVDPVQYLLIPAHITLCREDELAGLFKIRQRLRNIPFKPLTLAFGRLEASYGHGLLLNCIGGEERYHALRTILLDSPDIRKPMPHLTLAHPRNPMAPGNSLRAAAKLPEMLQLSFPTICLIEQTGGAPWQVLARYALAG